MISSSGINHQQQRSHHINVKKVFTGFHTFWVKILFFGWPNIQCQIEQWLPKGCLHRRLVLLLHLFTAPVRICIWKHGTYPTPPAKLQRTPYWVWRLDDLFSFETLTSLSSCGSIRLTEKHKQYTWYLSIRQGGLVFTKYCSNLIYVPKLPVWSSFLNI